MATFAAIFLLVIVIILAVELRLKMLDLDDAQERAARWQTRYDELATDFDRRHRIHCETLRHARRIQAAVTCILDPKQS